MKETGDEGEDEIDEQIEDSKREYDQLMLENENLEKKLKKTKGKMQTKKVMRVYKA